LEAETKREILTMPIHYEIETDALFLEGKEIGREEGLEKGFEKGIEKGLDQGRERGREETNYETVARMLRLGQFTKEMIALAVGVDITFVVQVERNLLGSRKN